jgi:mycothiol synthase
VNECPIRIYRQADLPALVALINESDAIDQWENATTIEQMEHEMTFPTMHPETDSFLAWDGDKVVGWSMLYVRKGDIGAGGESFGYCWGVVHPSWRRQGLGRRLLESAYRRAQDYLAEIESGRVIFQSSTRDSGEDRKALFESFGMKPVRYWVNLSRPLNGSLPPVQVPEGIRLRAFACDKDIETVWRVDNAAFRDHWGHTEGEFEEFVHLTKMPHFRPDLWFLAEETATGQVVGLGLNFIDPDWIAQTGRMEGYVDSLAVLRDHRKQGLGTALLVQSLHALRQAGMEAAHLDADAENLTGAMKLYERVGFQARKTRISYQRVIRES